MVKKTEGRGKKRVVMSRGAWTAEEDKKLVDYVKAHGEKKWTSVPAKAGLNRCGKSCRLRWLNYLRPGIKRGNISEDEEDLIIRLHNLLGNRWSLIAGRLPGRTDNEIKNYWNTHLSNRGVTIDDLNRKLRFTSENSSSLPNLPASTEANNPGPCSTALESVGNGVSDFQSDNNEYFYNNNELNVEDYGPADWDNNQDPFNIEFCRSVDDEGLLDIGAIDDKPSEFDELIRFLDL